VSSEFSPKHPDKLILTIKVIISQGFQSMYDPMAGIIEIIA
jgi:hypothetical protein